MFDIDDLRKGQRNFAYQLRKFFPTDETPISHYMCEEHLVVLSTKKMYVYYVHMNYIDYVGESLSSIEFDRVDKTHAKAKVEGKEMDLHFDLEQDLDKCLKYYMKYK